MLRKLRRDPNAARPAESLRIEQPAAPDALIHAHEAVLEIQVVDAKTAEFASSHSCSECKPVERAVRLLRSGDDSARFLFRETKLSGAADSGKTEIGKGIMLHVGPSARRAPNYAERRDDVSRRLWRSMNAGNELLDRFG